jgi:hypothetical protein
MSILYDQIPIHGLAIKKPFSSLMKICEIVLMLGHCGMQIVREGERERERERRRGSERTIPAQAVLPPLLG